MIPVSQTATATARSTLDGWHRNSTAPDAVILEAGDLETRTEYAAHHLGADIAFTRAVPSQPLSTVLSYDGAVAWVATTTTARGTYRDRPVASQAAELMVLSHTAAGWRIRAIHWSSRRL